MLLFSPYSHNGNIHPEKIPHLIPTATRDTVTLMN